MGYRLGGRRLAPHLTIHHQERRKLSFQEMPKLLKGWCQKGSVTAGCTQGCSELGKSRESFPLLGLSRVSTDG